MKREVPELRLIVVAGPRLDVGGVSPTEGPVETDAARLAARRIADVFENRHWASQGDHARPTVQTSGTTTAVAASPAAGAAESGNCRPPLSGQLQFGIFAGSAARDRMSPVAPRVAGGVPSYLLDQRTSIMVFVLYGVFAYVFFLVTFLYAIAFVGDLSLVPKTIDSGAATSTLRALFVDGGLLGLFAVQHSVMARRSFKRWWTRIVPEPIERTTFVFAATLTLALMLWQWRPIAEPMVWQVNDSAGRLALQIVFWTGWGVLLTSTFLLNHFELFGLRQVWTFLTGRSVPPPDFRTPLFYRYVRHPLYLGFLLAFWAAPDMTAGHLFFAIATTGYILLGIAFEERDLIAQFGERYRLYREQAGMFLPRFGLRRRGPAHH